MKNIFCVALLFISVNLNSQNGNPSLDKVDIQKIEVLMGQFESVLKKYYPEEKGKNLYQKYLSDLLLRKVSPQVIRENRSVNLFTDFKKSSSFKKVWKSTSKDNKTTYRINYKGAFFNYLIKNIQNEKILETLQFFRKEESLDLSPYILVAAMQTALTEKEYSTQSIKMTIAVMFYYDIILQFSTN